MSNLILYIGHTGTGKTHRVKTLLKQTKKDVYCFDVNDEYKEHKREIDDFKLFLENCKNLRDHNIIFEDATGYLKGQTIEDMRKLIVAKRHKKNNIIMLFHSINSVPPFIFELANYIVLMKTADEASTIKNKKSNLLKPFLELQKMPMQTNAKGKTYSPSIQIKNI
jgi:Cdc6-like AAA superfamily ATPase